MELGPNTSALEVVRLSVGPTPCADRKLGYKNKGPPNGYENKGPPKLSTPPPPPWSLAIPRTRSISSGANATGPNSTASASDATAGDASADNASANNASAGDDFSGGAETGDPLLVLPGERREDLVRVVVDFHYSNTLQLKVSLTVKAHMPRGSLTGKRFFKKYIY